MVDARELLDWSTRLASLLCHLFKPHGTNNNGFKLKEKLPFLLLVYLFGKKNDLWCVTPRLTVHVSCFLTCFVLRSMVCRAKRVSSSRPSHPPQ